MLLAKIISLLYLLLYSIFIAIVIVVVRCTVHVKESKKIGVLFIVVHIFSLLESSHTIIPMSISTIVAYMYVYACSQKVIDSLYILRKLLYVMMIIFVAVAVKALRG